MVIKKINLTGMSCSHCVRAVEAVLEGDTAIIASEVSIGHADITVNDNWDGINELNAELEKEGFSVQDVEAKPAT